MHALSKDSPTWRVADETVQDQRVDNYLTRVLKGVPRTHVYRLLRTGQVRVNSRRVDATYRLQAGDRVRIPPVRIARKQTPSACESVKLPLAKDLERAMLFEDDHLLVLDKPAGWAVHGGSGVSRGVIEEMRRLRPRQRFLELAHRLDRDTSGVLLLAKKRAALLSIHAQIRSGEMAKFYQLLVKGRWPWQRREVTLPLEKFLLAGGDRRVKVSGAGQAARTLFQRLAVVGEFTLLEAELLTGRTHQIRVHAAHSGYPLVGDDKYGDFELNKAVARRGLKRMFLHAARVQITHPASGERLSLQAPLPAELASFLARLEASGLAVE